MFAVREMTEEAGRLAGRIRRVLETRHAMHIGELLMRLGSDHATVRAELEAMLERGEIERLRPVDYFREDHDYFRANGPADMTHTSDNRRKERTADSGRAYARWAGETMACLAD